MSSLTNFCGWPYITEMSCVPNDHFLAFEIENGFVFLSILRQWCIYVLVSKWFKDVRNLFLFFFFFFPYFRDKEMRGKNAFEKEDFRADTHTLHLLATVNDFPMILSSEQLSSRPFQGDWWSHIWVQGSFSYGHFQPLLSLKEPKRLWFVAGSSSVHDWPTWSFLSHFTRIHIDDF